MYDAKDGASGVLIRKFEHRAPVLDICFGADDNEAFSAGLDWGVKRLACLKAMPMENYANHRIPPLKKKGLISKRENKLY
jgi:cell cycle arrest protein BUB3